MVELSRDSTHMTAQLGFAGDTLNTAIYLRRLLPENHHISYVTTLGTDAFSDQMLDYIRSERLATDLVTRNENRTVGLYAINTDMDGERSFTYWRDNSAARTLFQTPEGTDFSTLKDLDIVYVSAITLAILPNAVRCAFFEWIEQFRANGGRFAFDSNYRPTLWESRVVAQFTTARAWSMTDIALPSIDDEMALFGDTTEAGALSRLNDYGIPMGALKRGARGPVAMGGLIPERPYPAASSVVDTTAAGDSFNAGFLASILQGHPLEAALRAGHNCASRVIGHRGAIIPKDIWAQSH
ncbi:sugar kinase [Alphaproteobacteria bacterium KMM 3653]|uniref:Sugar kinase n=2 Tax=Harenicola maris TaxID=2841044 RepID=A0AAP2CPD5_9RHOB|nr:sugar kinase [Harenicola maris]